MRIVDTVLKDSAVLHAQDGGHLSVNESYIGYQSVIVARSSIEIGPGCWIGEMVVIRDQDHVVDGTPLATSGFLAKPIVIGSNVWIGAKATVLKGVTIGTGSVVAASAVVTRDVPPGWLYAGIPARPVRRIDTEVTSGGYVGADVDAEP